MGAAVEILDQKEDQEGHEDVRRRAKNEGRRDVRQVRLQRGRHHSGARLPHPPHAPQLVEGIPDRRRRVPGKEASRAEVLRRGEAGRGRLLPRAWEKPRPDDKGHGIPGPRDARRLDRRARARPAQAPRAQSREGRSADRDEGAGRRGARGPGRQRRRGRRQVRRVPYRPLRLAAGDLGA